MEKFIKTHPFTCVLILLSLVFIPWITESGHSGHQNVGYALFFSPPRVSAEMDILGILRNLVIGAIVGLFMDVMMLKGKNNQQVTQVVGSDTFRKRKFFKDISIHNFSDLKKFWPVLALVTLAILIAPRYSTYKEIFLFEKQFWVFTYVDDKYKFFYQYVFLFSPTKYNELVVFPIWIRNIAIAFILGVGCSLIRPAQMSRWVYACVSILTTIVFLLMHGFIPPYEKITSIFLMVFPGFYFYAIVYYRLMYLKKSALNLMILLIPIVNSFYMLLLFFKDVKGDEVSGEIEDINRDIGVLYVCWTVLGASMVFLAYMWMVEYPQSYVNSLHEYREYAANRVKDDNLNIDWEKIRGVIPPPPELR